MQARRIAILFMMIFLFVSPLQMRAEASKVPIPVGEIYVQDFAEVLTKEQKNELLELGAYIEEHTHAQIALLTVQSLNGLPVEEYALQAFRQYELEKEEEHTGILLLLSLQDRKVHIEVGYGLVDIFSDKKVGSLLEHYALPYLEQDEIGLALTNTYKQLFNEVADEYRLKKQVEAKAFEYGNDHGPSILSIIIFTFIAVVLIFLDFRFLRGIFTLTTLRFFSSIFAWIKRQGKRVRKRSD
ncbi:TPM domain-containing protein [Bacillus sp. FJAT-50079]|uniref:TPM domain-containing protein n=1 Tax=Bacillus sp. FJAT-50079 TaxID=2833577 RepID=UPI001BCA5DDD|nr:TPM domain-containing protein [Bacillus sp. FJAT-50079]MBS4209892.1 TPM domain-containing protein [Bacillus sp. FJAT-50079]